MVASTRQCLEAGRASEMHQQTVQGDDQMSDSDIYCYSISRLKFSDGLIPQF